MLIRAACRFAPQLLRRGWIAAAEAAKKDLPRAPGGGRSRALSEEEEGQVCEFIGNLLVRETSFKDAILRASQKFDVSIRTIERVWSQRLRLRQETLDPTFPEVVSALKKSIMDIE